MKASKQQAKQADIREMCTACERQTPHDVSVKILTESSKSKNAQFSREPYRVSVCQTCGSETSIRMNNA